jgi:putative membrane protein
VVSEPPGPPSPPSSHPPVEQHAAIRDEREETFRLHPLTPVALGGRVLGVLAVFSLFSLAGHRAGDGSGPNASALVIAGALAALVVVRGLITVAVTRYHLVGKELRIDSGLFQKRSKRVRLDRVQSVDILEPLSARIFGLAEVKVTTAGTERSSVRLRYVATPVARRLRADLLGRTAGSAGPTREAPERPVVAVPHGRLIGSVALAMISWRLVFLIIGPALTVIGRHNDHRATSGVGIVLFLWFAVLILHAVWRQVSTLWDFTITESPDGLRLRHGLLSTSRQTVPPGRIQAVLIHQPLAWRPFGWVQVRMNVAGYAGNANAKSTMLLPVADRKYASDLVGWLLGGVDLDAVPLTRPPRRAAVRTPLWWRKQLAGSDPHVFVARHGLLSRTMDVVPHERTQSIRLSAGPLQRALGLASVHLDSTRGPVKTRAANRDSLVARAMVDLQVDRARRARLAPWRPTAG